MNPYHEIKLITEQLRVLYRNTNEGPKLIADMIEQEFPDSFQRLSGTDTIEALRGELNEAKSECRELRKDLLGTEKTLNEFTRYLEDANARLDAFEDGD